ncbi:DinB family protein [Chamaesiphon minutus]|uniref:Damage-inducible protein DinB n=1 Tax=Chamaesiphon minutus (strain ATCC 27169 / PCC 6605) TaxID=1173020 RepID=K9UIN1_CHAP6|nr:DinB family protein [Chamaesiphon minutus]AFY94518.1 hypothetical protein Cha6605_3528 [Chamaesiphon minutus PCC 6605]
MNYYTAISNYNQWMNQKLYAVCADITEVDRKSDRGAFFKSIHGTLNHIAIADLIWLGRFTQQPFAAKLDAELYSDFSELRAQRERLDRRIIEWANNLTPDWLNADLTYTNSSGFTRTLPHWLLVTHMFNHQTHHRGQLTTLLNQMGYDAGVTDLPAMPEFQV